VYNAVLSREEGRRDRDGSKEKKGEKEGFWEGEKKQKEEEQPEGKQQPRRGTTTDSAQSPLRLIPKAGETTPMSQAYTLRIRVWGHLLKI
jgi:hypothetical protein